MSEHPKNVYCPCGRAVSLGRMTMPDPKYWTCEPPVEQELVHRTDNRPDRPPLQVMSWSRWNGFEE